MRIEEISLMNVQERVLRRIAIHAYGNRLHLLTKQQISLEANTPIRSVNRAIKNVKMQAYLYTKMAILKS